MSKKSTKRFTVLIVEDEDQVRGLLRECLEIKGYQVIEAGTGADALAKAVKHRPDAVFVDLGLPDMDGLSVIKRLREFGPVEVVPMHGVEETIEFRLPPELREPNDDLEVA